MPRGRLLCVYLWLALGLFVHLQQSNLYSTCFVSTLFPSLSLHQSRSLPRMCSSRHSSIGKTMFSRFGVRNSSQLVPLWFQLRSTSACFTLRSGPCCSFSSASFFLFHGFRQLILL